MICAQNFQRALFGEMQNAGTSFWRGKWQPTPVFLPGESQGWGSLVGCHLRGRTESDTTEAIQQQQQQSTLKEEIPSLANVPLAELDSAV